MSKSFVYTIIMKTIRFVFSVFFLAFLFSCQDDLNYDLKTINDNSTPSEIERCNKNREINIAIISDIHYMDKSLLVKDGPAFQAYLAKDPKLLEYSSAIFDAAIQDIVSKKPDLVLIPGDLTKDGERISHEKVAQQLRYLNRQGIKVLVTVGNHDVNNPETSRYISDRTKQTPTVSADRIPFIYATCGYNDALSRDPNSLSYVNEPVPGLWIITIDANRYAENTDKCITGGVIKPETLTWVLEQLAAAQAGGKTVIGMMHHGLMEHYQGQNSVDPGYVIENPEADINSLIDAGLKIILTGHYHATDITKKTLDNGKFVFDVETGSTVTYPCTYRMLTISGDREHFTFRKQSTTALMGAGFDDAARTFSTSHLDGYFTYLLTNMGVPSPYNSVFAPWFTSSAMAHFAGDETPHGTLMTQMATLTALGASDLANALGSFWMDLGIPDNNVTLNMATGAVE